MGPRVWKGFDWWDDMRKRLKLAQHMGKFINLQCFSGQAYLL